MIEDISVRYLDRFSEKPLNDPVFIEGLPGIGQVGKLVAEYMIHVLGAEKIAEVNSLYFPPQVMLDETGTVRLARNEIYLHQSEKRDLVFLVGDHQSASGEGHYILADCYCDLAEKIGARRIITLGGFGVGHLVDEPRVLGAVNNPGLRAEIEAAGVMFERPEPGGGIIGAAGLMLALSAPRGIDAVCLMGETSGYIVDPMAAASVLAILSKLIDVPVDPKGLNDRAAEMEEAIACMVEGEKAKDDELNYIG